MFREDSSTLSKVIRIYFLIGLIYGIYYFLFSASGSASHRLGESIVRAMFWIFYPLIYFFPETVKTIGTLIFAGTILYFATFQKKMPSVIDIIESIFKFLFSKK